MGADENDSADHTPDEQPDEREPNRGARKILHRELFHRGYGNASEELSRKSQPAQLHGLAPSTPAWAKVAMFLCRANAALMIGSTSAAPLPSPRRIPRSTIGVSSSAASATAWPPSA